MRRSLGRFNLMLNLSATRDNYGLAQRLNHVGRQMLRYGAACYKRRSAARKVKHDVAQSENGSQCIPQPLVGTWPVNGEASHHAHVGVVSCEVEVARIRIVVSKLPVVQLSLGEVLAESVTDSLAGNAGELASVEALEINVEAHGV